MSVHRRCAGAGPLGADARRAPPPSEAAAARPPPASGLYENCAVSRPYFSRMRALQGSERPPEVPPAAAASPEGTARAAAAPPASPRSLAMAATLPSLRKKDGYMKKSSPELTLKLNQTHTKSTATQS